MAALITGNDLGLLNNPLTPRGDGHVGRPGQSDSVYLNSATGNLIIQAQDEYLAGIGLDLPLVRTYNSKAQWSDDNADNWRLGVHQRLYGLTGTVNTAGSTITKEFGDGAIVTYTYDALEGAYVSPAGEGAHDTLTYDPSTDAWTWVDGSRRKHEVYDSTGRLLETRDTDGNTITYGYTGSLLTQITDASGQITYLDYAGTNLTAIRVVSQGQTQTLTRYGYDALNRLTEVTLDLSPEDNSITDGYTYRTTYTYDGDSTRLASITQGDQSTIHFTYEQVNGEYRVKTYTDGEGRVTTLAYTVTTGGGGTTTASADQGALSDTEVQTSTTTHNLNPAALSGGSTHPSPTRAPGQRKKLAICRTTTTAGS